jgi:hypothetical protein
MTTKRIKKFMTSESPKNTEAKARNTQRVAALKSIGDEASLEKIQARSDDAPKIARIENVSAEGVQVVNFAAEDKPHAPLGADEFGMPILPVPAKVALVVPIPEADADQASAPEVIAPVEVSTVAVVTENGLIEVPATKPEKSVKKLKAVKGESAPTLVTAPKVDSATLFANFKAARMVNPFKETVKDHKRFNAVAGADTFEDSLPGFKDEKDLKGFIGWVLRGTPGYKK